MKEEKKEKRVREVNTDWESSKLSLLSYDIIST